MTHAWPSAPPAEDTGNLAAFDRTAQQIAVEERRLRQLVEERLPRYEPPGAGLRQGVSGRRTGRPDTAVIRTS